MVLPQSGALQFPTGVGGEQRSAAIGISSTQGFAYVAGTTPNGVADNLQLFVIDISDPTAPLATVGAIADFTSEEERQIPNDIPRGVAVFDDGEAGTGDIVYTIGGTKGDLTQTPSVLVNNGQEDAFFLQYTPDTDGNLLTLADGSPTNPPTAFQFGGQGSDIIFDAITVADGNGHSLYVVGRTSSTSSGDIGTPSFDFFGRPSPDNNFDTSQDNFDAFVAKFDPDTVDNPTGDLRTSDFEWITRIGSVANNDEAISVDFANGNLYVAGNTEGNLDRDGGNETGGDNNSDVWIAEIQDDPDGSGIIEAGEIIVNDETKENDGDPQLNTDAEETVGGITVSGGDIYISGSTEGLVDSEDNPSTDPDGNRGNKDAFVAKFQTGNFSDTSTPVFVEQFGSFNEDISVGVEANTRTTDEDGDPETTDDRSQVTTIFTTGTTEGVIDGELNSGGKDTFVAQFEDRRGNNPVLQLEDDVVGTNEPLVAVDETFIADNVASNGLIIGTVNAGDPDGFGLNYTLNVDGDGTPDTTNFDVDSDGEITLTATGVTNLGFDDSETFEVEVTTTGTTPDIGPTVLDQDFVLNFGGVNNGDVVGSVVFGDADNVAADLTFDIDIDGTPPPLLPFSLATNGQITVNDATEVEDATEPFNLTVTVTDPGPDGIPGNADDNTDTAQVDIINAVPADNTPVIFDQQLVLPADPAIAVDPLGRVIADINDDTPGNDTELVYRITAGNEDSDDDGLTPFDIDADTGEITITDADEIDPDTDTFTLTVEVAEDTNGNNNFDPGIDQNPDTATVNINAPLFSDGGPTILDQQFVFAAANFSNTDVIGTVTFGDPDTPDGDLVFKITSGNESGDTDSDPPFAIDEDGQITVTDADEITGNPNINLTVAVVQDDNGSGGLDDGEPFDTAAIGITLEDTDTAEINVQFEPVELIAGISADRDRPDNLDLLGTQGQDNVRDIAVDRGGNFYITGDTTGQFLEADAGADDIDNFAFRFGENNPDPVIQAGDDGGAGGGAVEVTPIQAVSPTLNKQIADGTVNNGLGVINNSSITFAVEYAATQPFGITGNNTTPLDPTDAESVATLGGIGLRIHFNSDEFDGNPEPGLSFQEIANQFEENNTTPILPRSAQEDTEDFDSDPATDAYVPVTFFNQNNNFPGNRVGEEEKANIVDQLFDITFETNAALFEGNPAVTQDPVINFTANDTFLADGFSFGTNANNGALFQGENGNRDIELDVNRYTFDVDNNGEVGLFSDGLQIFNAIAKKDLFFNADDDPMNFNTDAIAQDGAIASDAQRSDPEDIFNYLQAGLGASANGNGSIFDLDGDGETTLLQDGILLLRFLSEFTGDNLSSNLTFEDVAQRTSPEAITGYINNFIPGAEQIEGADAGV